MTTKNLKTIVIVGGGTAGWMTAAALAKLLSGRYIIRLIESDEIATIGVGEATIPAIKEFNQAIGIDENEFLKHTQGTFKLGIEFVNWGKIGDSYIHGFGSIGQDLATVQFYQYWLKMYQMGEASELAHYSINTMAPRQAKFMRAASDMPNSPLSEIVHAFHFDANLYAKYLRGFSEKRGVVRTEGKVIDTILRQTDEFIEAVVLDSGETIQGEF